ncbi:hypothetical protein GCM10010298_39710 [Streptomyces microflavus]|nr:hypothetical protein GCM10010298_39710 [Streptomyces microflavus]
MRRRSGGTERENGRERTRDRLRQAAGNARESAECYRGPGQGRQQKGRENSLTGAAVRQRHAVRGMLC